MLCKLNFTLTMVCVNVGWAGVNQETDGQGDMQVWAEQEVHQGGG